MVSPWWVVTTAVCAQLDENLDPEHFVVVAGDWDLGAEEATEQAAHVEAVYAHPYFSSGDQGRAAHRGITCLK